MTFKEFMASRKPSFARAVEDFRIYIISDLSVPDFTERAAVETFLKSASSIKIRIHNIVAGPAWSAYLSALKKSEGVHRENNQLHAA